jgi:hypothetical protein
MKALPNRHAHTVTQTIKNSIINVFGCPRILRMDNAKEFAGTVLSKFCGSHGIKQQFVDKYFPQANFVERTNREIKHMLRAALLISEKTTDWDKYIEYIQLAYNSLHNSTLGNSPYILMFGHDSRLPNDYQWMPEFNEEERLLTGGLTRVYNNTQQIQERMKALRYAAYDQSKRQANYYNKTHRPQHYEIGQLVKTRNHTLSSKAKNIVASLLPPWLGPYKIIAKDGASSYTIEHTETKEIKDRQNTSHLKLWGPIAGEFASSSEGSSEESESEEHKDRPYYIEITDQDAVEIENWRIKQSTSGTTEPYPEPNDQPHHVYEHAQLANPETDYSQPIAFRTRQQQMQDGGNQLHNIETAITTCKYHIIDNSEEWDCFICYVNNYNKNCQEQHNMQIYHCKECTDKFHNVAYNIKMEKRYQWKDLCPVCRQSCNMFRKVKRYNTAATDKAPFRSSSQYIKGKPSRQCYPCENKSYMAELDNDNPLVNHSDSHTIVIKTVNNKPKITTIYWKCIKCTEYMQDQEDERELINSVNKAQFHCTECTETFHSILNNTTSSILGEKVRKELQQHSCHSNPFLCELCNEINIHAITTRYLTTITNQHGGETYQSFFTQPNELPIDEEGGFMTNELTTLDVELIQTHMKQDGGGKMKSIHNSGIFKCSCYYCTTFIDFKPLQTTNIDEVGEIMFLSTVKEQFDYSREATRCQYLWHYYNKYCSQQLPIEDRTFQSITYIKGEEYKAINTAKITELQNQPNQPIHDNINNILQKLKRRSAWLKKDPLSHPNSVALENNKVLKLQQSKSENTEQSDNKHQLLVLGYYQCPTPHQLTEKSEQLNSVQNVQLNCKYCNTVGKSTESEYICEICK